MSVPPLLPALPPLYSGTDCGVTPVWIQLHLLRRGEGAGQDLPFEEKRVQRSRWSGAAWGMPGAEGRRLGSRQQREEHRDSSVCIRWTRKILLGGGQTRGSGQEQEWSRHRRKHEDTENRSARWREGSAESGRPRPGGARGVRDQEHSGELRADDTACHRHGECARRRLSARTLPSQREDQPGHHGAVWEPSHVTSLALPSGQFHRSLRRPYSCSLVPHKES